MTDSSSAPAGWYIDGQDLRRRYWDGSQWTEHFEEAPQPSPTNWKTKRPFTSKRKKLKALPGDQLDAILNAEVGTWIAKGWTVEATTKLFGRSAMLREPRLQAFLRDLLLVLVTAGLWLIYIIYQALVGKTSNKIITVDRFGRVKTFRRIDELYGE
jgi:hypothetical protein